MDDLRELEVTGSDDIMNIVQSIADNPSKNAKVELIARHESFGLLKRVLLAALDPSVTYGITKRPETIGSNVGHQFDDGTWELLDLLAHRELSGNAAIEAITGELTALSAQSAELLWRIISKDLKAGFGDSTVNKAIKGLIPEFPYMRCSLPKDAKLDEWDWKGGVISQEKADGTYTNCNLLSTGEVQLSSRQGTPYPLNELSELVSEIKVTFATDTQTHGEIVVLRDGIVLPREISNGIINHVVQGGKFGENEYPQYQVWEQIPLSEVKPKNVYKTPYRVRLGALATQIRDSSLKMGFIKMIPTKVVTSLEEATAHFREMLQAGKEGTVMKEPNAPWKDGTSKFQVKRKIDVDVELEVIGFEAGKGKNEATFGSLICRSSDLKLEVSVSGFSDKLRQEIYDYRDNWLGSIITVKFNAIMYASEEGKLHSLFLPRFVEQRMDKSVADSFERIIEQYNAAINEV